MGWRKKIGYKGEFAELVDEISWALMNIQKT
jgi:hypothetical protein